MPTPTTIPITDYDDRAIARLPSYQNEAINWGNLLRALMTEVQSLENALGQIENERHLSVAIGVQLDEIGTILNESRQGRSDDIYRLVLQGVGVTLSASGEGDLLIDGYLFLTVANSVELIEHQPATVELFAHITFDDIIAEETTIIVNSMAKIKAQGVELSLVIVEDVIAEGLAFTWGNSADADVNGDLVADVDHGYGDSADADGSGDITPGLGQGGNFGRLLT